MKKMFIVACVLLAVIGCSVADKDQNKTIPEQKSVVSQRNDIKSNPDTTHPSSDGDLTMDGDTDPAPEGQDDTEGQERKTDPAPEGQDDTEGQERETDPKPQPPVQQRQYKIKVVDNIPYSWTDLKRAYFSVMPVKYDTTQNKYVFIKKDGTSNPSKDEVKSSINNLHDYQSYLFLRADKGGKYTEIRFSPSIKHVAIIRSDWSLMPFGSNNGSQNYVKSLEDTPEGQTRYISITGTWYKPVITDTYYSN